MVYVGESCTDQLLKPIFTLIQAGDSCKWVHDSQHFLLEFFDTIYNSPSQIYHSALPFSPSSSWLHKCYNPELSQAFKVVKGLPTGWGSCSRTVTFDTIDTTPLTLAHWKETIAVSLKSGDIIILDVITGSQVAVFSGRVYHMVPITFSSDGKSLVAVYNHNTFDGETVEIVKLWDVQTGGVVKTFHGCVGVAKSVSISSNHTTIAVGSVREIHLWSIQTGGCHHITTLGRNVHYVSFSPTNPQHLISISDSNVQQWDIDGHQIGPTYQGSHAGFSMDGTHLVMCEGEVITIRNSDSGVIVAKFPMGQPSEHCCLSPNGGLVAVAVYTTVYVWDITNLDPYLIETFSGHSDSITSLTFSSSSSLISASHDGSVKFWQIGASSTDLATNYPKSVPPTSASIEGVSLQAENKIVISSDSDGVVKIWDISTGLCKASFQTPANGHCKDAQMIDGRLSVVWLDRKGVMNIWDAREGEILQVKNVSTKPRDLRISGDGSKVVLLSKWYIEAWDIKTGRVVGDAEYDDSSYVNLSRMGGSRMCACSNESLTIGWDFGVLDSPPVPLPNTFLERLCLDFIGGSDQWYRGPCWIKNIATGKPVFRLPGRHAVPSSVDWDGRYLAAGYRSGEMLILDFIQMFPQ
jgi:WD40 repeat protein